MPRLVGTTANFPRVPVDSSVTNVYITVGRVEMPGTPCFRAAEERLLPAISWRNDECKQCQVHGLQMDIAENLMNVTHVATDPDLRTAGPAHVSARATDVAPKNQIKDSQNCMSLLPGVKLIVLRRRAGMQSAFGIGAVSRASSTFRITCALFKSFAGPWAQICRSTGP
jgi:hypothetical protein